MQERGWEGGGPRQALWKRMIANFMTSYLNCGSLIVSWPSPITAPYVLNTQKAVAFSLSPYIYISDLWNLPYTSLVTVYVI